MKILIPALVLALAAAPLAAQSFGDVDTSQFKHKSSKPKDGAKPLNLSGLLGPSSVPGPSAGPTAEEADPAKEVVLAAVDLIVNTHKAVALEHYKQSLFKQDMAGDKQPPTEQDLKNAGEQIKKLLAAKKITFKTISARDGGAGEWSYNKSNDTNGNMVDFEGEFKVGKLPEADQNERNFSRLFKVDQWANTILHETSHMIHTMFVEFYRFQSHPQEGDMPLKFASYHFWNGMSPSLICPAGGQCPFKRDKPCKNEDCYVWNFGKQHAKTTNERVACELSQAVCDQGSCEAYKKLVGKAR